MHALDFSQLSRKNSHVWHELIILTKCSLFVRSVLCAVFEFSVRFNDNAN